MTALKASMVWLALCSLLASSLVLADDCRDSLVAEACGCRTQARSDPEPLRKPDASTTGRQAKGRKKAIRPAPQREKGINGDGSNPRSVAER